MFEEYVAHRVLFPSALEAALRARIHLGFAQILVEVTYVTAMCGVLFRYNCSAVVCGACLAAATSSEIDSTS